MFTECSCNAGLFKGRTGPEGQSRSGVAFKAFVDPRVVILVYHFSLETCGLKKHCLFALLNHKMTRFIVKVKALFVNVWPCHTWVESDIIGFLPQEKSVQVMFAKLSV